MPSPSTVAEFLDLVRKSGVIDEKRLDAQLEKLRAASAMPTDPGKLAGLLVRDGVVTFFQAKQFMDGKWRRFTLGKYKVLEQLGAGGMGSVYLCEHMMMRRRVAVKVLPATKADDPASLERFQREARAVAALDHPNIVRAYDIDQVEKLHFLVMEYVDGASLQEIVKKTGPMDVTRAAHYIRQSALGLQHAHESGLVHRDIKPGNILVDRNGIVKVLDMGLARFFNDEEDVLTKKYDENVLGTADYLAPEQALDSHSVTIRADIYSLGATFYFCLTGRTPFSEGTVAQKLIWHQTRQPKPVRSLRPDVDEGVVAILERMMAKRAEDRYQTPQAVAEALAPWTQTAISPPPDAEMPHLSPAARGGSGSDAALPPPTVSGIPPSPGPRKNWQVTTTSKPPSGSALPTARPGPSPAAAKPPSGTRPVPPRPTPSPAAAPAAIPQPATTSVLQVPAAAKAPAPPAPAEEAAPWEKIAGDTDDLTARLDTARDGPGSSRRRTARSPGAAERNAERARRRLIWLLAGVGLVAVVSLGLVLGLLLGKKSVPRPNPEGGTHKPTTHYVGDDSPLKTIGDALSRAQAGDRILIRKDAITERLVVDEHRARELKNIRIEGDPGRTVVWKAPEGGPSDAPLLRLNDVEGFHIKNVTFDGENKVKNLIVLECGCKGVRLEDLNLRNFTASGVKFMSCMAPGERPIVLTGLQSHSLQPTLVFEVFKGYPAFPKNDNIQVQDDCAFQGNREVPMLSLKEGDNAGVRLPPKFTRKVILQK